jgi:hypothetical protein
VRVKAFSLLFQEVSRRSNDRARTRPLSKHGFRYAPSLTASDARDRTLLGWTTEAAKLSQGKFQDALANLQSFRAKVVALEQQGKISSTNAAALISGADGSIACVQGLIDAQAAPAAA